MPYELARVRTGYAEDMVSLGRRDEADALLDLAEETHNG